MFAPQSWHDPKDATIYQKILARERTYDFLAGLDRTLYDICGCILDIKPLVSLDEIFGEVCREERRKHVVLLLLHPQIPLPWLFDSLMAETNKKTNNGVIIVNVRITRRLRVGNFMASLHIGSLVIFVVLIVKVFQLHQILQLLPILIFLSL